MIQPGSRLIVADNTGAREIMCIRTIAGARQKGAKLADSIIATVKAAHPRGEVKKKEVVRAVIIRLRRSSQRPDGTSIRFDDNAAVIIHEDRIPRGTRIFGPVARELRERGFPKVISQAMEVL